MTQTIWDIAEKPFNCSSAELVGQGEAFRVSKVPTAWVVRGSRSSALDGEEEPGYIKPRSFLDRLHAEVSITPGQQPAGRPLVMTPGSQPTIEPRGQRQKRYGVVNAMRATIDADWRRRQSGSVTQ